VAITSRTGKAPLRDQAANMLLRARRIPPGAHRNALRQISRTLLRLHKMGIEANVEVLDVTSRGRSRRNLRMEVLTDVE
jgi:hypothetical protein